ncbi:hypothetical protein [Natronolimnobius baerhuensis]|uniref:DUF2017 domain-containing protein n=1 Tax=Natronolimnobius baerhuensis TaxID=253108 RepID=A0A202E9D8_9EURY|nr:hypothetical protein [Natronolimnobius baerhuensis]OVE84580.1 hypothetical protein B2G88_09270 [Natronolimnobius baerhuensis]
MGILDLMLGRGGGSPNREGQTYTLPQDTHEFVYPVAVRRTELEAFATTLEAEANAPSLEDNTEDVQAVLDDVLGDLEIDASELAATRKQARANADSVIDHWLEQLPDDAEMGVVYARPGTHSTLLSAVKLAKQRADDPSDEFELPAEFGAVTALLTRLNTATDSQYRAVVHTDLLAES